MTRTLLLVEDDAMLREMLRRHLERQGYRVFAAARGEEALRLLETLRPDLILSDVRMPGLSGDDLCRILKNMGVRVPVLLMSGEATEEADQLRGYACGACEYLLKPFQMSVLLAKIGALLEMNSPPAAAPEADLRSGGLRLSLAGRYVYSGEVPLRLTRKEFDLLTVLMKNEGRVLSANALLEKVWGYDPADYNYRSTVEVHVCRLRRKLGAVGRITTLVGVGYRFEPAR